MNNLRTAVFVIFFFSTCISGSQNTALFDLYYKKYLMAKQNNKTELLLPIYKQLEKKLHLILEETKQQPDSLENYKTRHDLLNKIKPHNPNKQAVIKKQKKYTLDTQLSINSNQGSIIDSKFSSLNYKKTESKLRYQLLTSDISNTHLFESQTSVPIMGINSNIYLKLQKDDSNKDNSFYQIQHSSKGTIKYLSKHTFSSFLQFRSLSSAENQSGILDLRLKTTLFKQNINYGYYANFAHKADDVYTKVHFKQRSTKLMNLFGYTYNFSNRVNKFIYKNTKQNELFLQTHHHFKKDYTRISSRATYKYIPENNNNSYVALYNKLFLGNIYKPSNWNTSLDLKKYSENNPGSYTKIGLSKLIIQKTQPTYQHQQKIGSDLFLFDDTDTSYAMPFWQRTFNTKEKSAWFSNQIIKLSRRHQLKDNNGSSWTIDLKMRRKKHHFTLYYISFDNKKSTNPDLIRISTSTQDTINWKTLPITLKFAMSQDIILIGSNSQPLDVDIQIYYKTILK